MIVKFSKTLISLPSIVPFIGKHISSQFYMQRDALISHSSKSYYACVGESTHAYQSPSKDLTAINNHLNGYVYFYSTFKTF